MVAVGADQESLDIPRLPRRNLGTDTRTVQEEAPMSDQPSVQASSRTPGPDLIPLLPRGEVLFEDIPLKAVVLDALAPALVHGSLVVRDRDRGAVVLVRDGTLVEVHAFSANTARSGDGVLAEVQGWPEAVVSAHRLDALLVDVCEALLRGEVIYTDLRLDWVEWPALLADFTRRGGAYAVEIFTSAGRGVTCVAVGQQALSYTDIHPSLGDPALLEAMASNREGSIRVRRLNAAAFAATTRSSGTSTPAGGATTPDAAAETAADAGVESSPEAPAASGSHRSQQPAGGQRGNGAARRESATPAPAPREGTGETQAATPSNPEPAAPSTVDDVLPDLTWVAPWQTPWREEPAPDAGARATAGTAPAPKKARPSVGDMLSDLRSIAQRRLQLSASRVETVLDEAAREQRPLDAVLEEIRAMSIRGVMPSTVDAMVAEMKIAAAEHRSV
ncbi:MAG: hypothetical protein NVS3B18_00430 [Candidatus Dormibacteria bacterium]